LEIFAQQVNSCLPEDACLLRYDAVSTGEYLLTFRNISLSGSGGPRLLVLPNPEDEISGTSVTIHQSTRLNIPKDLNPQQHHCDSVKT
jgi:hypothetical protein